jgi:hypothetical protein
MAAVRVFKAGFRISIAQRILDGESVSSLTALKSFTISSNRYQTSLPLQVNGKQNACLL